MTERVFWCDSIAIGEQTLDDAESRHARTSLRLEPGAPVTLLDGAGRVGHAIVLAAAADRKRDVPLRVRIESIESVKQPERSLTLIVAACKGERMDWLVEKCTELGVDRLWIATFERTVANPGLGRLDRFERLARQACKQCCRAWLPELRGNLLLADAVDELRSHAVTEVFVAHPDPAAMGFGKALRSVPAHGRGTAVIVGPEGGLSNSELAGLRAAGARVTRIAGHTLRIETAAQALAAIWADSQLE